MINKILYSVLILLLCGMTFPIGAQNTIVLKNNTVDVSGMEKITFDNSVTPPLLIGHTTDSNITVPLLDKTAIPFFSGLDLNGKIYEARLTGQTWTHYYLTPIGYFYLAPVNALLDEEEQVADDTRQVWLYQSFDTLEWAFITTDQSLLSTENIEYTTGDFSINYIPDAVETYHIVGDGNLLEKSLPYNADQILPDAYSNKLLKMIYGLTQTLAGYTPEAEEAQFAGLIEKFKSLLGMSVAQTAATNTFATTAAQKLAKKKIKRP